MHGTQFKGLSRKATRWLREKARRIRDQNDLKQVWPNLGVGFFLGAGGGERL